MPVLILKNRTAPDFPPGSMLAYEEMVQTALVDLNEFDVKLVTT